MLALIGFMLFLLYFTVLTVFFFLSQHVHRVPSSRPKVQVFVYSALLTAAPHLRLPPSACAATATTVGMVISQINLAPVSIQ